MSATLYVGPVAAGKTAYAVARAREAARGLAATPAVVVASSLQVHAFQRRLAAAGGAMGVHVSTLPRFCQRCLSAADGSGVLPPGDVLQRLLEAASSRAELGALASLADKPGFWVAMRLLIAEAKASGISADQLERASDAVGVPARLRDLAAVYQAYERILDEQGWLDAEDALAQAGALIEAGGIDVAARWPLVIVDGFDDFAATQRDLLRHLAARTELLVLLADDPAAPEHLYRRYARTRRELEQTLAVEAQPLPTGVSTPAAVDGPRYLLQGLTATPSPPARDLGEAVTMAACGDRLSEVRTALRWLKARIVQEGVPVDATACIARDLGAYRPHLEAVAREYGLPLRVVDGARLGRSPVIQGLLGLVHTQIADPTVGRELLEPRLVLEAWRSPYLDWGAPAAEAAAASDDGPASASLAAGDAPAAHLDELVRRYRILGGAEQWEDAFRREERRLEAEDADEAARQRLEELRAAWDRFLSRIAPRQGLRPCRDHVAWLEEIVGPDPVRPQRDDDVDQHAADDSLGVVRSIRALGGQEAFPADREAAVRDIAALQALKDLLRAMVWVDEALQRPPMEMAGFVRELDAAVRAATYRLPVEPGLASVLALDVAQARGLRFEAVALLGLAEGEFPAVIHEDVFLTDADRDALARRGLPLRPSTESYERELFLVAISRASQHLLLTRPRLADNGASWQPSPYWEEVRRLLTRDPLAVGGEAPPSAAQAASLAEALALLRPAAADAASAWLAQHYPHVTQHVRRAAQRVVVQSGSASAGFYGGTSAVVRGTGSGVGGYPTLAAGDLSRAASGLARQFDRYHPISASRLEAYAACPYLFLTSSVFRLEEREPVAEGLNAAQRGSIYHRILAEAYAHPQVSDPADVEQVLAHLPEVLERVLDAAPDVDGFRPTAWWRHTKEEIAHDVEETVVALAETGPYTPRWFEQRFGRGGMPALGLERGGDGVAVSGIVDRIDVRADGGLRVIDYKTGGKGSYTAKALERGEKLQVALYALAARDALGLGQPVEGFYWHVCQAEPSGLRLSKYGDGLEDALTVVIEHVWRIVEGIRAGRFAARPPATGCPSYCPAAAYCWRYRPGWQGG
jgi:RecB family exonuclease/superfamily I DNA/RNA helicase